MIDRKAQLQSIADGYFSGLTKGDVSGVPYDDDVVFRTPLAAGGSEEPIRGKLALLEFFAGIYPALGEVRVVDCFFNDALTAICVRAYLELKSGKALRVVDVFHVSPEGKVIEQENHYDPRPAMG